MKGTVWFCCRTRNTLRSHDAYSTRSSGRMISCVRHFVSYNSHCSSSHPAYDFSLRGVVESPNILAEGSMRYEHRLTPNHPAQLQRWRYRSSTKYRGRFELRPPFLSTELSLDCINLNKRAGQKGDERMSRAAPRSYRSSACYTKQTAQQMALGMQEIPQIILRFPRYHPRTGMTDSKSSVSRVLATKSACN